MATIDEILSLDNPAEVINELKYKTIDIRPWSELEKEYNKKLHPVYTDKNYRDKNKETKDGGLQVIRLTRIALGLQKLAVKRIGELCFGIPVKRIWKPKNEQEQKAAKVLEAIFQKNKIDSVNIERSNYLYASCEFVTIWYTQEQDTEYGGEKSKLKLRCKSYSPMKGTKLYPLFDEFDDMIALSIEYSRKQGTETTTYFETYTSERHIRWMQKGNSWEIELDEQIQIGKIAGVYQYRPEPIWEDESDNVYEAEWQLSRQGNYLRKNLEPIWVVFADETIEMGKENNSGTTGRKVLKYPKDAKAGYQTWEQAIDNLKYFIETIRQNFFAQLQLPEMSSDAMKSMPMSAESRKMIFIDGQLKVTDESGMWYDTFYREINVVKAFAKKMFPKLATAIESLQVQVIITPYNITDESERINMYSDATGGKQVMSQRTAIERLGYADDVDAELQKIADETVESMSAPTI